MGSVYPVRSLIELSELYHSRSRLPTPRYRLHALLALVPACRSLGMGTATMEREIVVCLEKLSGARARSHPEVRAASIEMILKCSASHGLQLVPRSQDLARALFLPGRKAVPLYIRTLLEAGWIDGARRFAAGLQDRRLRHHAIRLATTGVQIHTGRREFVAPPFGQDDLAEGLPRFLAMAKSSRAGAPLDPRRMRRAEALLARLVGRERQLALAHWAAAVYHVSGLESARAVQRSVRYRSTGQLAGFLVLRAALDADRWDDACRAHGDLNPGAYKERAGLLLARAWIGRGRLRAARRLLSHPVAPARELERLLLVAEIDRLGDQSGRCEQRMDGYWHRSTQRYDDLSSYDPQLPTLRERYALLHCRLYPICRRGLSNLTPEAIGFYLGRHGSGTSRSGRGGSGLGTGEFASDSE